MVFPGLRPAATDPAERCNSISAPRSIGRASGSTASRSAGTKAATPPTPSTSPTTCERKTGSQSRSTTARACATIPGFGARGAPRCLVRLVGLWRHRARRLARHSRACAYREPVRTIDNRRVVGDRHRSPVAVEPLGRSKAGHSHGDGHRTGRRIEGRPHWNGGRRSAAGRARTSHFRSPTFASGTWTIRTSIAFQSSCVTERARF